MFELANPNLAAIPRRAVIIFPRWTKRVKFRSSHKAESNQITGLTDLCEQNPDYCEQPDPNAFNCRVRLTEERKDQSVSDVFTVEIRGSIHAPSDKHYAAVRISITDVTDGIPNAKPVQAQVEKWQMQDSPTFCYNAELGKLPRAETILSEWTNVAWIEANWLMFPREGKRDLQFNTSILSRQSAEELACATCTFTYENSAFGYIDLQENIQRTNTLAVVLAFAVSAADKKLFDCEIELIKNWARDNIDVPRTSAKARRKFEKALNKTVVFFRNGNQIDAYKICKEIVEIVPVAQRYDILELCLNVTGANGVATVEELTLLKNLAHWLEVDTNRFCEMMQRILPVGMHEVEDAELILGVSCDMSKDQTRKHLNKEYRKWNARVIGSDPAVQSQADQMLELIAEARSEYVG